MSSSRSTRRDGECSIVSPARGDSRSPARGPGRREVTAVEAAPRVSRAAAKNAVRNQLEARWIQQDVFQFLRGAEKSENNTT